MMKYKDYNFCNIIQSPASNDCMKKSLLATVLAAQGFLYLHLHLLLLFKLLCLMLLSF